MADLKVLRWFVETARSGSFTVTANKFKVTSSAVSQGMARLEHELNVRLFNRTTRKQSLTTEGKAFLARIEDGLVALEEAVSLICDTRNEPSGLVRISAPSSYGKDDLFPVLAEFLRLYPKVDLDISFHDGAVDLIEQGLDLALVRRGDLSIHSVTRRLGRHVLVLAASPAYLERHGVPTRPMDLAKHEWITVRYPSGTFDFELEWVGMGEKPSKASSPDGSRRYKVKYTTPENEGKQSHNADQKGNLIRLPRSRVSISEQIVSALDAALLGMGIAILTLNIAQRYLKSGELKVLLPDYRPMSDHDIFIEYPHKSHLPSKTRKLIDFLSEHFPAKFANTYDPKALMQYAADPAAHSRHKTTSGKAKRKV